jgi:hypothetical protein
MVFLMAGVLLVIAVSVGFDQRPMLVKESEHHGSTEWSSSSSSFVNPSILKEGAGTAGIVSVAAGFVILTSEVIKLFRRRQLQ